MATSYVPPLIEVYQEFKAQGVIAANPLLDGVVVGPHYHIVSYEDNKDAIYVGDYDDVSGNTFFAPESKAGMTLKDDAFLKLYVDDASVEIDTQADGVTFIAEATSDQLTSATADWVTAGVAVGDDVNLDNGSNDYDYKVLEVVDANTLRMNKNIEFTADETGVDIVITRLVHDKEIDESHYTVDTGLNQVTLAIATTVTEDEGLKTLI